ncbi:MAG: S1 RNA-binding domain-containing protein [Armatimonadetes bacterium]|nr:S1 RNA-binding domain-containing protein [Armatimonadota bacterium]
MQEAASRVETILEVGSTVVGTVVKLAEYGAIVRLEGGNTGLVHISEVADTFVRDINDHFKEHDRIRATVLSRNGRGRYQLSTKKIEQPAREPVLSRRPQRPVERIPDPVNLGPEHETAPRSAAADSITFEDRLKAFLKDSNDRQFDVKRHLESKRGSRRR